MRIRDFQEAVERIEPSVLSFLHSPKMVIGGKSLDALSGETFEVATPSTGAVLARPPKADAADVNVAVEAARAALEGQWANLSPVMRQNLMLKFADLLEVNGEEMAQLETLENGKSIMVSRLAAVTSSANYLRYMAGWTTKIAGETLDVSIAVPLGAKFKAMTHKEPVGVVAAITPWNFPLTMAVWKIAPAIAAGCTVVLKPAEETPLTAIRLAEIAREAGMPDGVINVVTGGSNAGAALVEHPGVDKITFTGSTETGKRIGVQAMTDMKRVTLELGGKAPMLMFDDMDLNLLKSATGIGMLFNSGQTCCAGTRIYLQRGIYEEATEALKRIVSALTIGDGLDPRNQLNAMVSKRHQAHVNSAIEAGIAEGATPLLDCAAPAGMGYYVAPQLFADVNRDMSIMQNEIFGPVATLIPFDTEEDVIPMANDTRYGLSASIWTSDLNRMMRVVPQIKAGTIWVNTHNTPDQNLPFGGYKQSGLGREHGSASLENFLETKAICVAYR